MPSTCMTQPQGHAGVDSKAFGAPGGHQSFVPNLHQLCAISPKALSAVMGLQMSLANVLNPGLRERIGLTVSNVNGSEYGIVSHTYRAVSFAGLTIEEARSAVVAHSADEKVQAALQFARKVAVTRGHVNEMDMEHVRQAGYSDAQVLEVISVVIQCCLSNYITNIYAPEIDFPRL